MQERVTHIEDKDRKAEYVKETREVVKMRTEDAETKICGGYHSQEASILEQIRTALGSDMDEGSESNVQGKHVRNGDLVRKGERGSGYNSWCRGAACRKETLRAHLLIEGRAVEA